MIPVHCHSNLDLRNPKWPTSLPSVAVGDLVESENKLQRGGVLQLQVVRITWKHSAAPSGLDRGWYADVELHLPKGRYAHVAQFEDWYDYQTGHTSAESYRRRVDERLAKERAAGVRDSERSLNIALQIGARIPESVNATHKAAFELLHRLEDILHDIDGTKLADNIPSHLRGGYDQWHGLIDQFAKFKADHTYAFPIPAPSIEEPAAPAPA
mgnify:CR=1 FL=1